MESNAIISDDGKYRYLLTRQWGEKANRMVAFIGLNPSTADAVVNDRTIMKCIHFAKRRGGHGLIMVNLYALRSKDPKLLKDAEDPVGPENNFYLFKWANKCPIRIAMWGAHPMVKQREARVMRDLVRPVLCLGTTKDNHPKHPLYLKNETEFEVYAK